MLIADKVPTVTKMSAIYLTKCLMRCFIVYFYTNFAKSKITAIASIEPMNLFLVKCWIVEGEYPQTIVLLFYFKRSIKLFPFPSQLLFAE